MSLSGLSDTSYISGLSAVSYLSNNKSQKSKISGAATSDNNQGPGEESDIDLEDIVGSESYISPEMVSTRQYSYSSDLWALGVIIY